jgi:hypothetical protein
MDFEARTNRIGQVAHRGTERAQSNDDAAKKLHVHRITLTHRLRQIEQILAVDLSDPEQRVRLGMAVRAAPFCGDDDPQMVMAMRMPCSSAVMSDRLAAEQPQ